MSEGRPPDVSPDLPGLPWRSTLAMLERLPQAALSRSLGSLADIRIPRRLRAPIIGGFARAVGIDRSEAEKDVREYESLNAFFVRRLRPGVRSWPGEDAIAASPVDGIIGRHGVITGGRLIQAKGRHYSAADLIGDDAAAQAYERGSFITIYLSPRHYHRIHAPCGGAIHSARYLPGALLPVNAPAVMHVDNLFPRNERVLCTIDGALGRVVLVAVGAYNVGRISTSFDPEWAGPGGSVSNRRRPDPELRRYDPPLRVRQGDEVMAFHLGSTIVMLFEPGVDVTAAEPGTEVRLGEAVARRHE
jgi:phosphatidylserine decarboxylase